MRARGHWLRLGLALAAIALAVSVTIAEGPAANRHARVVRASGVLALESTTAAVLTASAMRPGETATGQVTVRNTGDLPASLAVSKFGLTDVPGAGGGTLSSRLQLVVRDTASPLTPLYSGPLDSMPARGLGSTPAGASHTYSFAASLPDAAGVNAVQGATTTVGFRWTAIGDDQTVSPPPPSPGPSPPPKVTPPPPPPPAALALALKGPKSLRAKKARSLAVTATCSRACTVTAAQAKATGAKTGALKVKIKGAKLTVALSKKAQKALKKAVAKRKKATLVVTATGRDASGATASATLAVNVVR